MLQLRHAPFAYALPFLVAAAPAQTLEKVITYTRFAGPPQNVKQARFLYDAALGTTSFTNIETIATTPGADGVLFAPDGDLVIGGQGNATHKVVISSGSFTTVTPGGVQSFHVMLDPSGTKIWTAGNPGPLGSVPLYPLAEGTYHPLQGDDQFITHLLFTPNRVYYTSSFIFGLGHFGILDLTTFTTQRLYSDVPWAHGMTLDCYTGHAIAFANGFVAQIDPATDEVVSVLDATPLGLILDQGTADGVGHLFIASNTGYMLFIDMTLSRRVGNADFVDALFLDSFIDDIAPDCGLGAPPTCPQTKSYWKHRCEWPVSSLTLGCQTYTEEQVRSVLRRRAGRRHTDASLVLAHQLIAAKLNVANSGNNWPLILPVIEQADALLCTREGRLPYRIRSWSSLGRQMVCLADQLEDYNEARLSPACRCRRH
jgi:hypothetical protein